MTNSLRIDNDCVGRGVRLGNRDKCNRFATSTVLVGPSRHDTPRRTAPAHQGAKVADIIESSRKTIDLGERGGEEACYYTYRAMLANRDRCNW
jgi:hypothetical protein